MTGSASGISGALSHRGFRLLFAAQLLSALGDGVTLVAVGFAILHITGSLHDLGLVLAARYVPLSAFLLFAGVLADRLPRKRLLVISDTSRAIAQAGLAILLMTGATHVWHCIALQVVYGTAEAFFTPALTGLVPQIVPPRALQGANSLNEITATMSRILGPALGGLLILALGTGGAIAFDALTFVASAVLTAAIRAPRARRLPSGGGGFWTDLGTDLAEGWREVAQRRWILAAIPTFTMFAALTIPAVLVLGPALSWRGLGGVPGWSALTSAFGAGALVGSLTGANLTIRRPGLALMGMLVVAGLRPAAFISGARLPAIAAYCFIAGAAMSLASVTWFTLLQRHLPGAMLSRVSAIDDFGTFLLTPVGYLAAGPIAAAVGLERCIALLAAVPVLLSLATMALPAVRQLQWPSTDVQPSPAAATTP